VGKYIRVQEPLPHTEALDTPSHIRRRADAVRWAALSALELPRGRRQRRRGGIVAAPSLGHRVVSEDAEGR
jgi:hypothetical protein